MKAPEKIILEIDRENHCIAKVSFGDIRKREIIYDIYEIGEEQTKDNKHIQITKIKLMRIKDFKKEYNAASKKNKVLCEHCGFGTKDAGTKPETPPWRKKLKDTLRTYIPKNERDAAKQLIRGYVERGDTINDFKKSWLGHCSNEYVANIGGYADDKKYSNDKILVTEVNNKKIKPAAVFTLREIYEEVKLEQNKKLKDTLSTIFCDPKNTFLTKTGQRVCGHVYGANCENKGCCKSCLERCNSRCHHSRKAGKH
jgi:hypothetical protein